VKKAYDNWMHVIEYDGKSLLDFKQDQGIVASQNDEFLNSYDHQVTLPIMSVPVPSEQPVMDSGPIVGGMLLTFRTIIIHMNRIEVKVGELLECCTVAVTCLNLNHEEVFLS
jgi:hypothetical protein